MESPFDPKTAGSLQQQLPSWLGTPVYQLQGTQWGDQNDYFMLNNGIVTLRPRFGGGRVYSGMYSAKPDFDTGGGSGMVAFYLSQAMTKQDACDSLVRPLVNARRYRIADNRLTLYDADGTPLNSFGGFSQKDTIRAYPVPACDLTGFVEPLLPFEGIAWGEPQRIASEDSKLRETEEPRSPAPHDLGPPTSGPPKPEEGSYQYYDGSLIRLEGGMVSGFAIDQTTGNFIPFEGEYETAVDLRIAFMNLEAPPANCPLLNHLRNTYTFKTIGDKLECYDNLGFCLANLEAL